VDHQFLGDSFDIIKGFWEELLRGWAGLYACSRFYPDKDLQEKFTRLTGIEMLPPDNPQIPYSLFNDPDKGITLKDENELISKLDQRKHISISTIIKKLKNGARCVITFDQSYNRNYSKYRNREYQLKEKMKHLKKKSNIYSFYYYSHAPFLFAFQNEKDMVKVKNKLVNKGIPEDKILLIT
jgi:hypothetical protein